MAYTTINKSSDYFNTKLYTGNSGTQSITGVGHQPDFVWIKNRTTNFGHRLLDSVRGATKELFSNASSVENTNVDSLTSFDSDGFSLGSHGGVNENSSNFVSWNWKANGAGSANTDGSITSTVSANTTSGFSIVSFTGTGSASTIGHGLNAVPKMYIVKNRSTGSTQWRVYHASLGATKHMALDATQAVGTASSIFNNTEPTSSVFSVGTDDAANKSGDSLIAYCFAEKKGFSKFGSYTGNGNADGTFVYTGFKPAWVMIKSSTDTTNWTIMDNKRDIFNPKTKWLYPNVNDAEAIPGIEFDFLSNGFKSRTTGSYVNASGSTYIYMAFAEAPLVGTNGVTAKAR